METPAELNELKGEALGAPEGDSIGHNFEREALQ